MKKAFRSLQISFLFALAPLYSAQADDFSDYGIDVVKDNVTTNWDFEKSYLGRICSSIRKAVVANPKSAEEWGKAKKYGKLVEVVGVEQAPGYSGTSKVDVKTKMSGAERPVVFRFWLKSDGAEPCIYGFNFFEEIPG